MKKYILIVIVLALLIQPGCKKDREDDLFQVLTSRSWQEREVGIYGGVYNASKSLYKVTFDIDGKFEFVYRQWGVMPGDEPGTIRLDTLTGEFSFISSDRRIQFVPTKSTDITTVVSCDTFQYYIADWRIEELNHDTLVIRGERPDTTNFPNCYMVSFFGNYNLKPFEQ